MTGSWSGPCLIKAPEKQETTIKNKTMKTLLTVLTAVSMMTAFSLGAEEKKYKEGGCCDKAKKAGKTCDHACCVKAEKDGKVCEKCNK
jgi:hypothetical protein